MMMAIFCNFYMENNNEFFRIIKGFIGDWLSNRQRLQNWSTNMKMTCTGHRWRRRAGRVHLCTPRAHRLILRRPTTSAFWPATRPYFTAEWRTWPTKWSVAILSINIIIQPINYYDFLLNFQLKVNYSIWQLCSMPINLWLLCKQKRCRGFASQIWSSWRRMVWATRATPE